MTIDEAVERARHVARTVAAPAAAEVDSRALWPEASFRALQEAGLGGLVVPRECGGLGYGVQAVGLVCEALGAACGSTGLAFGMHLVGSAVMAAHPDAAHRKRFLEPIARGRHVTTLALSEPGTGANFYLPETRVEQEPGGFAVTGSKSFVTSGGHADSYVISAVAAEPAEPGDFSCFVVERDLPGLSWGPPWAGWGMRGNSARTMVLERVVLPTTHLLGRRGDHIWYMFHVIAPYFIAAMSGTYLGIAAASLELARDHLLARRHSHSGRSLASHSVLQHQFGTLWADVERSRSLLRAACRKAEVGAPDALPAIASAKAEVAGCAERTASGALDLLGGRGYAADGAIQRHFRDARAAHVMAPTTETLRLWTARAVLGLPILGPE